MASKERDDKLSTSWWSDRVGQQVDVRRWGFHGQPVLLFPTAGGDAEEIERFLMIRVLAPLLDAGRIKVYSCDSVSGKAWIDRSMDPVDKARMQSRFDAFVAQELVPAIWADCNNKLDIITAGASIGAWNALSVGARHPEFVRAAISMSGTYELERWMGGQITYDFYVSSPIHFVPRMPEGPALHALRGRFFLLATGSGDYEAPWESWTVARALGSRGVPNRVDNWGPDWRHDWVTWREMLPKYLDELTR
jgi:esterase/lipase superfamily enzyme